MRLVGVAGLVIAALAAAGCGGTRADEVSATTGTPQAVSSTGPVSAAASAGPSGTDTTSTAKASNATPTGGPDATPTGTGTRSTGEGTTATSRTTAILPVTAAYLVPGTLGDKGFLDSAQAGMQLARARLGATVSTVEGGVDNAPNWASDLTRMSGGRNEIVVTGGAQVVDTLTSVAASFPHQTYIMFDAQVAAANVASITFRQNDVAFLAGVLAASVSADREHYPFAGGHRNVGVVGGQNIPAVNDFIVGFEAGAKAVDPSTTVQKSYVGSFSDTATAYRQASGMIANGADVIFAAAGGSGLGVLRAAADGGRYAIGVDADQNELYPGHVLASALKNVDTAVFDLLDLAAHGHLQTGHTYVYGIANDGVQLKLAGIVTAGTAATVREFSDKVGNGQIDVPCVDPFCAKPTG
jgi:basic membrane protein A